MAFVTEKTAMPVIFILSASFFNFLISPTLYQSFANNVVLGGPEEIENNESYLTADAPISIDIEGNSNEVAGFVIVDSTFLINSGNSLSNIFSTRDGLMIYKVKSGDTLSSIAAHFGISLNTIFWANQELNKRGFLRTGQELVILPVSGVLHQVKEGETLSSIAAHYGSDQKRVAQFNKKIVVGSTVIIPDAKPNQETLEYNNTKNLPNISGYLTIPTTGWNWGHLHYNNAIDIANACGTPIYAAAEGLVTQSAQGWNQGYGSVIVIEHPNGVSTRYAHMKENVVSEGQYVLKGDSIGYMGNSGNTHGPTGCHVHFEVVGAQNPFAKK